MSKPDNKTADKKYNLHSTYSQWDDIIHIITNGIKNKDIYPFAKLNSDNSVSILLSDEDNPKELESMLFACTEGDKPNQGFVTKYFEQERSKSNFPLTTSKTTICDVTHNSSVGLTTFTFNLSPLHLDNILKASITYSGYKGSGSLLSLYKDFQLTPGRIKLFPMYHLDGNEYCIRLAGCQFVEIPCVQLLKLMPDYDGSNPDFHWIPKQVQDGLGIDRRSFEKLTKDLMIASQVIKPLPDFRKTLDDLTKKEFGENTGSWGEIKDKAISERIRREAIMQNKEGDFWYQRQEGDWVAKAPKKDGDLVMVSIAGDQNSKRFYAQYGNSTEEELEHCVSVEIPTLKFLQIILQSTRLDLERAQTSSKTDSAATEYNDKLIAKKMKAAATLEAMIATEKARLAEDAVLHRPLPAKIIILNHLRVVYHLLLVANLKHKIAIILETRDLLLLENFAC